MWRLLSNIYYEKFKHGLNSIISYITRVKNCSDTVVVYLKIIMMQVSKPLHTFIDFWLSSPQQNLWYGPRLKLFPRLESNHKNIFASKYKCYNKIYTLYRWYTAPKTKNRQLLNSLTAIDGHDRQYFNKLCSTVVSCRVFIRSQSLIAR